MTGLKNSKTIPKNDTVSKKVNYTNFNEATTANFRLISNPRPWLEKALKYNPHYKTDWGSSYFYTKNGLFRKADHWNSVGKCTWTLENQSKYQEYQIGYARWEDFKFIDINEYNSWKKEE